MQGPPDIQSAAAMTKSNSGLSFIVTSSIRDVCMQDWCASGLALATAFDLSLECVIIVNTYVNTKTNCGQGTTLEL